MHRHLSVCSALHQLILSINLDIGSPSHNSNTASTNATVYPAPTEDDLPSKKRKLSINSTDGNDIVVAHSQDRTQHARLPNLVLENKHVTHLHSIIKKECEELAAAIEKVQLWVTLAIPKYVLRLLINMIRALTMYLQDRRVSEFPAGIDNIPTQMSMASVVITLVRCPLSVAVNSS